MRTKLMAALLGVCVLGVGACGGDDDSSPFVEGGGSGGEDVIGGGLDDGSKATIVPDTATIGAAVRYAGFVFELGDAELGPSQTFDGAPDSSVGRLTIDAKVENLGDSAAGPDPNAFHLERDGAALDIADFFASDLPMVPGRATSNGEIVADGLPADFTLDGVELVFGNGSVHQARVPLSGDGDVVALDPLEISPGPAGQAGETTITITGGRMLYDSPNWHEQIETDKAHLYVEFDLTASAALNGYSSITYGDLQLGLPDGTRVAASVDSVGSVVGPRPSETLRDLFAYFEVPADVRGSFDLVLTGNYTTVSFEATTGSTTFELPQ